jgi:hypothetical protein
MMAVPSRHVPCDQLDWADTTAIFSARQCGGKRRGGSAMAPEHPLYELPANFLDTLDIKPLTFPTP